jgi:glycosyltransferase involved in cell wall biosynthesis
VTIWYDVTDLTYWQLNHLTGIQRTTVGVLNGLVACGAQPQLVRFDVERQRFEPLDVASLPAGVVRHLPWAQTPPPEHPSAADAASRQPGQPAPLAPQTGPSTRSWRQFRRRWLSRDAVFGTSPAAAELRVAFREFKQASRQLRKRLSRWMKSGFRGSLAAPRPRVNPSRGRRTTPVPAPPPPPADLGQPGDVLLSLCASWTIPGHADAVAALRTRGLVVLRMIYDLIPTIKPQWVDELTSRQVTRWVRTLLTESDGVLTISEFSRSEIEAYCEESRLAVPPLAVVRLGDELDSADDPTPPLPRFVPRRPFFVCVSTLDIRKNHRLLYDAWQVLAARDPEHCPDLVCLGVPHLYVSDLMREIRQDRSVNGRIHFLHGIDDVELAWYYRHCAATIYPSRYEGWGLPVAESLGHGRLCLASNATSIPEISPDLPVFFDPLDTHGLVGLIEQTLRDPDWVAAREAEIHRRFTPTPWSHTARQVLDAVEAARAATERERQAA